MATTCGSKIENAELIFHETWDLSHCMRRNQLAGQRHEAACCIKNGLFRPAHSPAPCTRCIPFFKTSCRFSFPASLFLFHSFIHSSITSNIPTYRLLYNSERSIGTIIYSGLLVPRAFWFSVCPCDARWDFLVSRSISLPVYLYCCFTILLCTPLFAVVGLTTQCRWFLII